MGNITKIGWTDSTFNPWWGCVKVSPECFRCYADTFSNRLGMKLMGPGSEPKCKVCVGLISKSEAKETV